MNHESRITHNGSRITPEWYVALVALAMCAIAFLIPVPPLQAASPADPLRTSSLLTNTTLCVTNATTNTINGDAFYVRKNQGVGITAWLNTTNTAANDIVYFTFTVSPDGTNYTTTTPFTNHVTLNGTTAVVAFTNWPATLLNNVQYMRLKSIGTAGTNSLWISNLWYSYHN